MGDSGEVVWRGLFMDDGREVVAVRLPDAERAYCKTCGVAWYGERSVREAAEHVQTTGHRVIHSVAQVLRLEPW